MDMNKKLAGDRGRFLTDIKKEVAKAGYNSGNLLTDIKLLVRNYKRLCGVMSKF